MKDRGYNFAANTVGLSGAWGGGGGGGVGGGGGRQRQSEVGFYLPI